MQIQEVITHKKLNGELQLPYKSYAGGIETHKQQHKLFQKGSESGKFQFGDPGHNYEKVVTEGHRHRHRHRHR